MLFLKTLDVRVRGFWEKLKAADLGTGSSGAGTKYLADDMTWKTPSGSGGFSYTLINLTFASSPYTVLPTTGYTLYNVNCTGGNIIINFPTAVGNAAVYGIKKTDSSANTITLTPNGVETIDGEASKVILFQNTQVEVYSNNANLFLK